MNKIDKFIKEVIGSSAKISDISARISPSGDFARISGFEAIISSWDVILRTPEGTYDNDPEFGSNLMNLIFEPADESTADQIKSEIQFKLTKYDGRANIKTVDVNYLLNKKGFTTDITAEYNGKEEKIRFLIDETYYFNFLRQN